jgi:hypothetical protein
MGVMVDVRTGEFVAVGDLGNLAEEAMVLHEMGETHFVVYREDDAYGEFA